MRKARRLPLEELAPYLLDLEGTAQTDKWLPATHHSPFTTHRLLDWFAVFGNAQPVELEVGFGKGAFLVAETQSRPDVNFLGIEIDRGLLLYVATRLAKRRLRNVRLVQGDARTLLRDWVPASSLSAIHVYFPDPWWKMRHKKRRVFTADFAAQCERALQSGGRLWLASDVEEYFAVMVQLLAANTRMRRIEEARFLEETGFLTNFARKANLQGREIWRAVYSKDVSACANR